MAWRHGWRNGRRHVAAHFVDTQPAGICVSEYLRGTFLCQHPQTRAVVHAGVKPVLLFVSRCGWKGRRQERKAKTIPADTKPQLTTRQVATSRNTIPKNTQQKRTRRTPHVLPMLPHLTRQAFTARSRCQAAHRTKDAEDTTPRLVALQPSFPSMR